MMVAELEVHSPLKANTFTLTHFKVRYDFVRHPLIPASEGIEQYPAGAWTS